MTTAISKETTTAIQEAISASKKESKYAGQCKQKTRDALNLVYNEVSNGQPMTIAFYEKAREIILETCKTCKTWPQNDKGKKVGYQQAMKNSETAIWYNKAQALLGSDLANFKKALEEQNEVELALTLTPDELTQHKQTLTEQQKETDQQKAFLAFVKLFETIEQADKAFQDLTKTYKATKK